MWSHGGNYCNWGTVTSHVLLFRTTTVRTSHRGMVPIALVIGMPMETHLALISRAETLQAQLPECAPQDSEGNK